MSELVKKTNSYKITEFQKHSGLIYMSHPFGKKALMCFNVLLFNSYVTGNFKNQKKESEIKEQTLFKFLGLSGVNARTNAKKIIEEILKNPLKFNVSAKDKKNKHSWDKISMAFTDFDFDTKPGYILYKYNENFLKIMDKPNAYAKFNILVQNNLKIACYIGIEKQHIKAHQGFFAKWVAHIN